MAARGRGHGSVRPAIGSSKAVCWCAGAPYGLHLDPWTVCGEASGMGCGPERNIRGEKGLRGSIQIRAGSRRSSLRPLQPIGSRREGFPWELGKKAPSQPLHSAGPSSLGPKLAFGQPSSQGGNDYRLEKTGKDKESPAHPTGQFTRVSGLVGPLKIWERDLELQTPRDKLKLGDKSREEEQ